MKHKLSRFNIVIPASDGTYLLYNTLSGALGQIDQETYSAIQNFAETGTGLTSEVLEQLQGCKFIVDKEFDEILFIRRRMMEERFADKSLNVTIVPTLQCNFACTYCYESSLQKPKMDDRTIEQVERFLEQQIHGKKSLQLVWFGGEPLLALDTIEKLTPALVKMTDAGGLPYQPRIVTNGYLLTEEVAKRLAAELKIVRVQITLDGLAEVHNQKRPLKSGKPTFDQVVANIITAAKIFPGVSIRVNVDQNNIQEAHQILDLFDIPEIKAKLDIHFAMINAYGNEEVQCVAKQSYDEATCRLERMKLERGFKAYRYPAGRSNFCSIHLKSNYVIAPDGQLYKCWVHMGQSEKVVGDIFTAPTLLQQQLESEFMFFDPTLIPECRECKILPLCIGGCYWERDNSGKACSVQYSKLEETLKQIVQNQLYIQLQR